MNKKFENNRTKIKGGCQSGRKVVTYNSRSDLPLKTALKTGAPFGNDKKLSVLPQKRTGITLLKKIPPCYFAASF